MAVMNIGPLWVISFLVMCFICTAEQRFSSDLESVVERAASGKDLEWDYSEGPNGPAHWGEISKEWAKCSEGSRQSPIDVDEANIKVDRFMEVPAKIYYKPAPAFVHGDGKNLEVFWGGGIFNCHDYDYLLEKLVFHAPSEHTYFGERFPLEIQFYHSHSTQGVAINSLVFREGEANTWLQQLTPAFPTRENLGKTISVGMVNSAGVEGADLHWNKYFRYLGSLNIPPCTERPSVMWSLLKSPLTASKEQIERVVASLLNTPNSRPIQPINTRHIFYPQNADDSN